MKFEWWMFVIGAVLSWGIYVPVLHEGQVAMGGGKPSDGAVRAFLCVGIAYFITAVVVPVISLHSAGPATKRSTSKTPAAISIPAPSAFPRWAASPAPPGAVHHLLDQVRRNPALRASAGLRRGADRQCHRQRHLALEAGIFGARR